MSTHLIRCLALLLAFAATLGVAGCGKKDAPGGAPVKAPGAVRKVPKPADALSPYLVTAVPTGKSGTASVQLKFELGGRPEPGDPLDIDLVILPTTDLDRVAGTVQGDDGLEIVDGATLEPADKPAAGTPIHRSVRALPRKEGIFVLSAVVSADSGGQPVNQTFLIPVIAGNGLAEAAAAQAAPANGTKPTPTAAAH
jgi:hypothetical protein